MAKHVIASVREFPADTRKLVEVKGRQIAVFNIKGEFFALANRCPHQGGSALIEGPYVAETFVVSVEDDYLVVDV